MIRNASLGLVVLMTVSFMTGSLNAQDLQEKVTVIYLEDGLRFDVRTPRRSAALTVTGGKRLLHQQAFDGDDEITYSILDERGDSIDDGSYAFELRIHPVIDEETRRLLAQGRQNNDDTIVAQLRAEGRIPEEGVVLSGSFSVSDGSVVPQTKEETLSSTSPAGFDTKGSPVESFGLPHETVATIPSSDVVFNEPLIARRACIGASCEDGEAFPGRSLKLHGVNTGIHFDDSSTSTLFPNNDWQLTANDDNSGGLNRFSIDDLTHSTKPFSVLAAAPSNSLFINESGLIGMGTSTPVTEIHAVSSNTPTLRLEQDGSAGWIPHYWNIAGNEIAFRVQDRASSTPLLIRAGAPDQSLVIGKTGAIGHGVESPESTLDFRSTSGDLHAHFQESSRDFRRRTLLTLSNNGGVAVNLNDDWRMTAKSTGELEFKSLRFVGAIEFNPKGDVNLSGDLFVRGVGLDVPDYVFAEDYPLMPLQELQIFIRENGHLPEIPSAETVKEQGLGVSHLQMSLLKKIEELTLYILQQQRAIDELLLIQGHERQ